MSVLRRLFRRDGPPPALRLRGGDAFEASAGRSGLTAREAEIVRLLLEGRDNRAITEALFISDHTVKNHIHNIYRKLGVRNRVQLVRAFQDALEEPGRAAVAAAPAAARPRKPLSRAALAAVLVVGLAAALIAWRPWLRRAGRGAAAPPPALAVLDFENASGDADLGKWATGLPALLTTDLQQSRRFRTVGSDLVFGALKKHGLAAAGRFSREELRRLARELKADYLLCGRLMKAGPAIVVTTTLQDARTGDAVRTDRIVCADEQALLGEADALCRLIKSGLERKAAAAAGDDIDFDVEELTTSYALAYRYYAEALRYHATGDYERSLLMLKKAVELDPQFALAYRLMSVDARNLGYFAQEAEYMRTAFELSGRLPESSRERHLIRGDYYSLSEATFPLAVEAFRLVLEDHPDDLVANNNLAMLYYDLEDYEAAARSAEVPIRGGTDNPFPYHTRAIALRALGRGAEAARLLEAYHAEHPANRLVYETLLDVLIDGGEFAAAEAALAKAEAVFPDPSWSYWRGAVLFHTRGAAAAREEFRRLFLMEEAPWFLRAHTRLGAAAEAVGRFREAAEEYGKGADMAETTGQSDWVAIFRLGRGRARLVMGDAATAAVEAGKAVEAARKASQSYRLAAALTLLAEARLAAGDAAGAEAAAAGSRALASTGKTARLEREHEFTRGLIDLAAGRTAEALGRLEKVRSLVFRRDRLDGRNVLYALALAEARDRAGDAAGAAAALRPCVEVPGDILRAGGNYGRALLALARLDEKLGRTDAARAGYRAFLEIWKDAEPGRPEIEEARSRLSSLPAEAGRDR